MNWASFKDPLCYLCLCGIISVSKVRGGGFETHFLQKYLTNSIDSTEFICRKNSIVQRLVHTIEIVK